jgi:hypothetical protein
LARIQGWFYVITGLWPLLSGGSFQAVTGFKADFWLARTVGLLLAVSGGAMILAARNGRITSEIILLGAGQAAALAVTDAYCVALPRTTPVYWLDAVVEAGLAVAWAFVAKARRRDR